NVAELLAVPLTITTTDTAPFARPEGTTAVMDLLPQLVVDATTPPNVTVLVPLLFPKPFPLIVTEVPEGPEVGDRLVMEGAAKREPLARATMTKNLTEARKQRVETIALPRMCG